MTNSKLTDEQLTQIHATAREARLPVVWTAKRALAHFKNWITPEMVEYMATELQERRKSFRWISIDEELPEDESTVIVKNIDGVQWVADFSDDCFYPDEFPVYKMGGDEVTHWMRFPE